jgi:hypothetical protein
MRRSSLLALLLCLLALPAAAHAQPLQPVRGNPADRMLATPIDPMQYDEATHCVRHVPKGSLLMQSWLDRHARGVSWGILRCEMWGKHSASLHAEGRAIDWHLDHANATDRAAAKKLIALLLAPDRDGNEMALARRMGVSEIIWNCSYWGGWGTSFSKYRYCYDAKGRRKKHLNRTQAHMNHMHIGLNRKGAAAKTSFWRSRWARR